MRRQILYGLLQDDDPNTLHFLASFILFDGRQNEVVLQLLNEEGVFARLLELIQAMRRADLDGDAGLHRLLMDLIYEMSRIQRIKIEDLGASRLHICLCWLLCGLVADEGACVQFSWTMISFVVSLISSRISRTMLPIRTITQ